MICIDMTCLEDTVGCEAWTWTDENNQDGANYCWMYSNIGEETPRGHCVSGPSSCLCSRVEDCLVDGDNEVDLVPNVFEVDTRQQNDSLSLSWKYLFEGDCLSGALCCQQGLQLLHLVIVSLMFENNSVPSFAM